MEEQCEVDLGYQLLSVVERAARQDAVAVDACAAMQWIAKRSVA